MRWIAGVPPLEVQRNGLNAEVRQGVMQKWKEMQLDMKIRHGPTIVQGSLMLKEDGTTGNIFLEKKDGGVRFWRTIFYIFSLSIIFSLCSSFRLAYLLDVFKRYSNGIAFSFVTCSFKIINQLAPGQYVVFYKIGTEECLGAGVISERHWANFLQNLEHFTANKAVRTGQCPL